MQSPKNILLGVSILFVLAVVVTHFNAPIHMQMFLLKKIKSL